ncbi:MAG: hypothetical protein ACJAZ2_002194 [Glaciecola sp.]|jgi:hypothetical protein
MKYISVMILGLVFLSCKKTETKTVYQVQEVFVDQPGADKPNVKKSTEYISIAYSDLFQQSIPTELLDELTASYVAFADVTIIEDLIVKSFLNDADAVVPTDAEMRADIPGFVKTCYNQFYGREATGQEAWFLQQLIEDNTGLTTDVIYYSFLTSNEYRQF